MDGFPIDTLILVIPVAIFALIYFVMCNRKPRNSSLGNGNQDLQMSRSPIVTITANDILLDENMKINEGTRNALKLLAQRATLFIFVVVKDQKEADSLLEPIATEFKDITDRENILYCQTPEGRASMARQLRAVSHIDYDVEVIHLIANFFPGVLIAPPEVESQYARWRATSFQEFMTNGDTSFLTQFPH